MNCHGRPKKSDTLTAFRRISFCLFCRVGLPKSQPAWVLGSGPLLPGGSKNHCRLVHRLPPPRIGTARRLPARHAQQTVKEMRPYHWSLVVCLTVSLLMCRVAAASPQSIPILVGFPILPGLDHGDDWLDILWVEPIPIARELHSRSPRKVPRPIGGLYATGTKYLDAVLPDPHDGRELIDRIMSPGTREIESTTLPVDTSPGPHPAGRLLLVSKPPRFVG